MKLLCHKPVIMEGDHKPCVSEGKEYEATLDVYNAFGEIYIIDDEDNVHYFDTRPEDEGYFGNWFTEVQE